MKWHHRLPVKFTLVFYVTFAITVIFFAAISIWSIRENTYTSVRESLLSNVNFWERYLRENYEIHPGTIINTEILRKYSSDFKIRLNMMDGEGKVLFDSIVPDSITFKIENHFKRKEIQEAIRNDYGEDIRNSSTVLLNLYYVAKKLPQPISILNFGSIQFIRVSYELESLNKFYLAYTITILLTSVVLLVIGLFINKFFAERLTAPILKMVTVSDKITHGEIQQRIEISSNDELGYLARSINTMAEKLVEDIQKLQKLERVRSEFLANVSHELKTPIFTIQGFVETLLDGAITDTEVNRSFLNKILKNSIHLNNLVSDLIEISRIETGELKMSFQEFDLGEAISDVIESLEAKAKEKNILLSKIIPNSDISVYADKSRIFQVLTNLVMNSIKYTDEGSITIKAELITEEFVKVSVIDTGLGIAHEHINRIFERFYRVDKHRSKDAGGTGLGLAIVKHILEAHTSKIQVDSVLNHGTTMSFKLFRKKPDNLDF